MFGKRSQIFLKLLLIAWAFFSFIAIGQSRVFASELERTTLGEPSDNVLRLLTFNIHHGADGNNIFDLDATIATIQKSGADIIALQEVDRIRSGRSQYYDEAQYIAEKLGMNYAYGATLDSVLAEPGVGEYGIMILSKFPIVANELYVLPSQLEKRGILYCTIQTPLGNFNVGCTHLGVSVEERNNQINALLDWLPQQNDLLVMGDFNTTADTGEFQALRARFQDLQEQYGLGGFGTIDYYGQWKRIDFIYGGSKWLPINCQVLTDATSDHRPVYLEVVSLDFMR